MSAYFFDTSALVKLYHPEAGTKRVEAIFQHAGNRLLVSRLTVVEMESAFSIKLRTGAVSIEQRRQAAGRFYLDLGSRFKVISVTEVHFSLARLLILNYGASSGLRTLDALQIAVASELRRVNLIDFVVASDKSLSATALAERIPVIDPLSA